MNVLITGASGFIGTYIVKELKDQGHHLIAITRKKDYSIPGTKTYQGDITDPLSLEEAFSKPLDAVIHNAAYANDYGKDPRYYNFNVKGTQNIADLCKKHHIPHLLYTSTAGIYGFPNNTIPIKESDGPTRKAFNAYGKTKIQSEELLKSYTGFKKTIFRPPMVFGAGGKPSLILLQRIQQGKMAYIGRGEKTISVTHPADVAQCFLLALKKNI
jgi:nucleoside-diphosphate-sugar epimerase